jgi:hypothetical protein
MALQIRAPRPKSESFAAAAGEWRERPQTHRPAVTATWIWTRSSSTTTKNTRTSTRELDRLHEDNLKRTCTFIADHAYSYMHLIGVTIRYITMLKHGSLLLLQFYKCHTTSHHRTRAAVFTGGGALAYYLRPGCCPAQAGGEHPLCGADASASMMHSTWCTAAAISSAAIRAHPSSTCNTRKESL